MKIIIIDYGSGNIASIRNAFLNASNDISKNVDLILTKDPDKILKADKIILPGVGDFSFCKKGLLSIDGMHQAIYESITVKAKPFLGICVGMQLMAEKSYENGSHSGLSLIKGEVKSLKETLNINNLKIPHMGWNQITKLEDHSILKNIKNGEHFYFVHSYHMVCSSEKNILAITEYGENITAAIFKDNLIGVQFHPEKSQKAGQVFINNFLNWKI